ncbi:MAG: hypothetical protein Q9170_005234 [Blastenia crenularia]
MGQRHQLFVIAKINGHYRQLCAIHHQWLYGHTALRRCLDSLRIFQHPANRLPLQQELTHASNQHDDFWSPGEDGDSYRNTKNSNIPFPFVMTCLIIGASFHVDGYYHGVLVEPFYMKFDEGDNNNGITIFDITDLNNVRYCFVDFYGMESEREVELMTPLSARSYLEAYYEIDETEDKPGLLPLLEDFKGHHLITSTVLKETWPHGDWHLDEAAKKRDPEVAAGGEGVLSYLDAPSLEMETSDVAEHLEGDTTKKKSLRDLTMAGFLDILLDPAQDTEDLIREGELLSDFVPKLRHRLFGQAEVLTPSEHHQRLLCKALENDVEVDFSPFSRLTAEHLSALVTELRGGKMRTLNLSNRSDITDSDLSVILSIDDRSTKPVGPAQSSFDQTGGAQGDITSIVLLETPHISMDFVSAHLGIYDTYHSELLRQPLTAHQLSRKTDGLLPALQFSGPDAVTQFVWVGISSMQSCDSKFRLDSGYFDWSKLKYSVEASSRFSGDPSLKYKNFILDVPLPASKTVHSLQRLMQYLTSPNMSWLEDWPKAAARCFATTSVLEDGASYSVGPLSTTLYDDDDRGYGQVCESGKGRFLQPGQWTIILVHEAFDAENQEALDKRKLPAVSMWGPVGTEGEKEWPVEDTARSFTPKKRLRYALAKALDESGPEGQRFFITDVPGYVQHVHGSGQGQGSMADRITQWWALKTASKGDIGFYDESDADALLHRIYSNDGFAVGAPSRARPIDPFEDIMRMMTLSQRRDG